MPRADDIDQLTKERIAAHLRRKLRKSGLSKRGLAKLAGVDPSVVIKLLNGERTSIGLGAFIKIHRNLKIEADTLLNVDPDEEFFHPVASDDFGRGEMSAERPRRAQQAPSGEAPQDIRKRIEEMERGLAQLRELADGGGTHRPSGAPPSGPAEGARTKRGA